MALGREQSAPPSVPQTSPHRRHELDWLRGLVILNLIPFHAAWLIALR